MGAEGLLSGWWSALLHLLPTLCLSHKHARYVTAQRLAHTCERAHGHAHKRTFAVTHGNVGVPKLSHAPVHARACAICKTSPSQPEDKGAVVARQQVSLAPTHLETASAPTISQ